MDLGASSAGREPGARPQSIGIPRGLLTAAPDACPKRWFLVPINLSECRLPLFSFDFFCSNPMFFYVCSMVHLSYNIVWIWIHVENLLSIHLLEIQNVCLWYARISEGLYERNFLNYLINDSQTYLTTTNLHTHAHACVCIFALWPADLIYVSF